MSLIYRRPWDSQPLGVADIDWSNPLTRDMLFCYVGGINRDLVSGIPLTNNSSVGTIPIRGGVAANTNGSSSYLSAAIPSITLSEHTMFALVQGNSPATDTRAFAFGSSSDNNPFTQIGTGDANAAKMRLFFRTSGGASTTGNTTSDVFNRGRPVAATMRVRFDPGPVNHYAEGFVDGVYDGTSTGLGGGVAITVNRVAIGALLRASPAVYYAGLTQLAVAWKRPLSNGEIALISANPWQLFEPRQAILIPSVPAGIVTPTLLTASGQSITSTSFRPRVTFSRP